MLKAEKVTVAKDLAQLRARYQRAFFTNERRPFAALLADETGTVAIPAFADDCGFAGLLNTSEIVQLS